MKLTAERKGALEAAADICYARQGDHERTVAYFRSVHQHDEARRVDALAREAWKCARAIEDKIREEELTP